MDRLIRECQSIVELNRIIDRGLDDETYRLAMDRLFELVLEGERDDGSAETATPANDADMVVSPEKTAVMDDTVATSNDGYNRERNGPENNQDMNETIPSTSTGATSIADVINSMDDVESAQHLERLEIACVTELVYTDHERSINRSINRQLLENWFCLGLLFSRWSLKKKFQIDVNFSWRHTSLLFMRSLLFMMSYEYSRLCKFNRAFLVNSIDYVISIDCP